MSEPRVPQPCPVHEIDVEAGRLVGLPDELRTVGRALLAGVMHQVPHEMHEVARAQATDLVPQAYRGEVEVVADWLGVEVGDVALANCSYDLVLALFGCSTVALATPAGPVLARNLDWWPEDALAAASFVARLHCGDDPAHAATASFAGMVGVTTGMALPPRAFAVALNAVGGGGHAAPGARSVLLFLREVLDTARDFDEALAMLRDTPLRAPALFTLVGARNDQRVVVERGFVDHALRTPDGDEPLVATNDYRRLGRTSEEPGHGLLATSCGRFDALTARAARWRGESVDDATLVAALAAPDVCQQITAQHVVLRTGTSPSLAAWRPAPR